MRIKNLFLGAVFALAFTPINNVFADAQNFYFEDFTADYYLTKLEDGTSKLHVKEVLTAVFPQTNQNHGITREIPYLNQNGRNRTIANKGALNLKVLRNGEPEDVNKIVSEDGYYNVYIGDANRYVHGRQVYTLEYDYTNVITEFDANGNNVSGMGNIEKVMQELYWDSNGTDWRQRFGRVTANLHTTEEIYKDMGKEAWCYVGKYGVSDKDRCTISSTDDGFSFTAENLGVGENLTFVTEFKPDTFKVILEKSYILIIVLAVELIIMLAIFIRHYIKWVKTARKQRILYKSLFVAPQYQPPENKKICVAEAGRIYIKKTRSSYVATLLELAVQKKITIKKEEYGNKNDWSVTLNVKPTDLTGPQRQMLNILNGGSDYEEGKVIPIIKHTATRRLSYYADDYKDLADSVLVKEGYLAEKETKKKTGHDNSTVVLIVCIILFIGFFSYINEFVDINSILPGGNTIVVGGWYLCFVIATVFVVFEASFLVLKKRTEDYSKCTEDGIKLVRYMEGMELYIKMAESERLKFLQSVEGADTSNEGIVKLYEKLLPWASLFGAEESWARELAKYYEIEDIEEVVNSDVLNGIIMSNIARDINKSISSSTNYTEPSSAGGSWSSGSSGGGGGGFSGGGGGGGGGGGW